MTLKRWRLRPGTYRILSSKMSRDSWVFTSTILICAVPWSGALTRLPLATSMMAWDLHTSCMRSSLYGVMWLEQPESINQSDMEEIGFEVAGMVGGVGMEGGSACLAIEAQWTIQVEGLGDRISVRLA